MAIAGSLVVNMSARTAEFETAMRRSRKELVDTQKVVLQTQQSFVGLGTALTGLTAGVVSLGAFKTGLESVIRTGQDMERLRSSFTAITGSVATGRQEFQFVAQTANTLGLSVSTLADNYRSLTAATRGTALAGTDTRELFSALTNASRAYGLSTEQTGRALSALEQIISKGKVSQEELRQQLAEAIPGANQIAARAYNVTTRELEAMVTKGLDATEFIRKFTAQLQREAPIAADVAGSGFTRLGNEIAALKDRIAQSGLLEFLDRAANKAAHLLNLSTQANEAAQNAVIGRLGKAADLATPQELKELLGLAADIGRGPARLSGLSPAGRLAAQAAQDVETRQELERRILEVTRRQRALTPLGADEFGPERFGGRAQANAALIAQQRAAETEAIKGRFAEIQNRQDALLKAQEEGAQKAKTAAAAAHREELQHVEATVRAFKQRQEAADRVVESLQVELDRLTLSEEAFRRKQLIAEDLPATHQAIAEGLLQQVLAAQQVREEYEGIKRAAEDAAQFQKEIAEVQRRSQELNIREERELFKERQRELKDYADFFAESIVSATNIGKTGVRDFVDSALADLQRLLVRQYLSPKLSELLLSGVQSAIKIFGATGSNLNLGPTVPTFTPEVRGSFQHGGVAMGPGFYRVGEAGSEIIGLTKGTTAQVYPHGTGPAPTIHVTVNVTTRDAESFQRDRAAVGRAVHQALQSHMRNL